MNRCYIRGWTPLGLLNTVTGCLFNRVLVRVVNTDGWGQVYTYHWEKASEYDSKMRNNEQV